MRNRMLHVPRVRQYPLIAASCSKSRTVPLNLCFLFQGYDRCASRSKSNAAGLELTVGASCSESGTVADGDGKVMRSASCSKGKTVNAAGLELTVRAL